MKIKSSYLFWTTLAVIALAWVGLRFYNLSGSEIFYGDTARDYLAGWQLVREHKPVWLGPSNSATPLSQSAFYFYLLAPLLAVTNFAFYANQLTLLVFTWIIILICAKLVYPRRRYWLPFFLLLILLLLQPNTLAQSRMVWNPSFAWQGLFLATWLIFTPPRTGRIKQWIPVIAGLALAFANAMSFIVAPAVLVFALPYWWSRERWLDLKKYALGFIGGSFFLFLPMLVFEIRYQFQITRRFLGSLGGDMVRILIVWGSG